MDDTKKTDQEAENSQAPYNDSEAGNAPLPNETGGEKLGDDGFKTPEQEAEVEGERVNNPQSDAEAPTPAPEPEDSGTGADPEDSKVTTPEEAEAYASGEGEDEVTEEERAEFDRLKTKRKNMPLSPEDIDRWETLNRKING